MKTLLLWTLLAILSNSYAQVPSIRNFSFENWTNYNGIDYPDDWVPDDSLEIQIGAIKQAIGGSHGNFALHLGSYLDQGDVYGSSMRIRDTLPNQIGGISFDYIVKNNNTQWINGLYFEILFYDKDGHYLNDEQWAPPALTNNNNYINKKLLFTSPPTATNYLLRFAYVNYAGSTSEFTVVDNVKFLDVGTSITSPRKENLEIYPNPTVDQLIISWGGEDYSYSIMNLSGQVLSSGNASHNCSIYLADLPTGFYLVKVQNNDSYQITRIYKE